MNAILIHTVFMFHTHTRIRPREASYAPANSDCGGSSFSTSSYADAIGFSASRTRSDYIKTLAENHV